MPGPGAVTAAERAPLQPGVAADPARVAREFEALLLAEMLRAGGRPIGGRSLLDGGSAGRMYRDLFLQEVAQRAAARGGVGIADALLPRLQPGRRNSDGDGEAVP
jgi:Rod binding domain-containing protein